MTAMDKAALIRILVFLFAWLNQFLVSQGYQPLPVLGEAEFAAILTFVASVWVLMKDNKVKREQNKDVDTKD